jgi:hypothetical protein
MTERNPINKNKIHDNQKDLWRLKTIFSKKHMFVFSWISTRNIVFNTQRFCFLFFGHIYLLTHGSPWEKDITISIISKMTFYYKCVSFHVIPWDILCVLEDEKMNLACVFSHRIPWKICLWQSFWKFFFGYLAMCPWSSWQCGFEHWLDAQL